MFFWLFINYFFTLDNFNNFNSLSLLELEELQDYRISTSTSVNLKYRTGFQEILFERKMDWLWYDCQKWRDFFSATSVAHLTSQWQRVLYKSVNELLFVAWEYMKKHSFPLETSVMK